MLETHQQEAAVMGAKLVHNSCVIKGKRTKRQRSSSPPLALTNSANSNSSFESSKEDDDDDEEEEQEEEDMANCLILLARGRGGRGGREQTQTLNPPRTTAAASATPHNNSSKGAGSYLYECKTCSRCFPSFQALGGHRASHKKPSKVGSTSMEEDHHDPFNHTTNKDDRPPPPPPPPPPHHHHHTTSLSLQIPNNNNKSRIHECAICGAEFASGQALGGHMRRHRPMPAAANSATCHEEDNKKPPRNFLSLDLNLPAAPEDHEPRFSSTLKEQVIVFSASSLVDCHY